MDLGEKIGLNWVSARVQLEDGSFRDWPRQRLECAGRGPRPH